jgi:hypothetical protein
MIRIKIAILAVMSSIYASSQVTHEISVHGGGGLSAVTYKISDAAAGNGLGGSFGLGYTCFFNKNVGIYTGAEMCTYSSSVKLNNFKTVTQNLTDSDGDRFDMHSALNGYQETQSLMYLNIPVMLHVQTNGKFYLSGGIKAGIPLSSKYSSSCAAVANSGYYPDLDNYATEPLFAGYGIFKDKKANGDLDLAVSVMLSLEAGLKWRLSEKISLYTGAYFDYGVNNIIKDGAFLNYSSSNASEFTLNSALLLAEKTSLMGAGVKVRVGLGL